VVLEALQIGRSITASNLNFTLSAHVRKRIA
jgi:hypothetical protein